MFDARTVYNCTADLTNMKPHRLRVDLEKHICTELTVADIDHLLTETTLGEVHFQLSFYDDLSRLAKVCIVHGVLWSKEVTRGNCCAAQTFSYNKIFFSRRTTVPCANSSGHANLTPPDDAACKLSSAGALNGVIEFVWVAETRFGSRTGQETL